jgi:hypothetical protein
METNPTTEEVEAKLEAQLHNHEEAATDARRKAQQFKGELPYLTELFNDLSL